ncbi:MAG: alpha/beta hydrolase [Bacteroidota bacterium]|nr:alpha/beta hydrolase [Bacteroidota bacterium]
MLPHVVSGKIDRIENFQSKYIAARNVDIWLPEGYSDSTKYAVLYMHDGQMLFDPNQTWNKQAWEIDKVASGLLSQNKLRKFIVVGIWNTGQTRHQDYFPQKPFDSLTKAQRDTVIAQLKREGITRDTFEPQSDNYLKFIVYELRPYIDRKYSVYTDRKNTFIAGSSMGGLISIYAICEYPEIFGGAFCMSTHWVGTFTLENNPVPDSFIKYLGRKIPNPKNHRIYFDCGDETLDAMYPKIQSRVDSVMRRKGYTDKNWVTRYFHGYDHSEKSWNRRLYIPLEFLLKN